MLVLEDGRLLLPQQLALLPVQLLEPLCLGLVGERELAPAKREVEFERGGLRKMRRRLVVGQFSQLDIVRPDLLVLFLRVHGELNAHRPR